VMQQLLYAQGVILCPANDDHIFFAQLLGATHSLLIHSWMPLRDVARAFWRSVIKKKASFISELWPDKKLQNGFALLLEEDATAFTSFYCANILPIAHHVHSWLSQHGSDNVPNEPFPLPLETSPSSLVSGLVNDDLTSLHTRAEVIRRRVHNVLTTECERRRRVWVISVQWTYYKWREVRLTRLLNEGGVWGRSCTVWRVDTTESPFGIRIKLVPHYTASLLSQSTKSTVHCESQRVDNSDTVEYLTAEVVKTLIEGTSLSTVVSSTRSRTSSAYTQTPPHREVHRAPLLNIVDSIFGEHATETSLKDTRTTSSDELSEESDAASDDDDDDDEGLWLSDNDSSLTADATSPRQSSSSSSSSSLSSQSSSTPPSSSLSTVHELSGEATLTEKLCMATTPQSLSSQNVDVSAALLSADERVLSVHRCSRIHGIEMVDGIFVITSTYVHFLPTLSGIGSHGSSHGMSSLMDLGIVEDMHWPRHALQAVHRRRYLFRPVALQLKYEQRSALFVLDAQSREYIAEQLRSTMTRHEESRDWEEVPLKTMTRRWVEGRISSWHYLLYLNARAGRSVCDLTQYPIMPWTLRPVDLVSPSLEEHSSYRNLTLPMGAQSPERARHYKETFAHLKEAGETPFHYGSCYTSPAITLHFLVRLEPYTSQFIALQDGRFDYPERMFYSLPETWSAAAEQNPMDVRELIPELYALPELFHNINRLPLGTRQDNSSHTPIDNVVLPKWALGSSQRFVRLHRTALESSVVSSQLHHWIDLVFGIKQRGPEAVSCQNVFHPLTYADTLDVTQIRDPLVRQATIAQMLNFGQIPPQLFKAPHPRRTALTSGPPKHWYHFLPATQWTTTTIRILTSPVEQLTIYPSSPHQKGRRHLLSFPRRQCWLPGTQRSYVQWGYSDFSVRFVERAGHSKRSSHLLAIVAHLHHSPVSCVRASRHFVVTAGTDDCRLTLLRLSWSGNSLRVELVALLQGHIVPITAVAIQELYSAVVSGDKLGNVQMWDTRGRLLWKRRLISENAVCCLSMAVSGELCACDAFCCYVFSLNGDLLFSIDVRTVTPSPITCVAWPESSTLVEWIYTTMCFITGHQNGQLHIWKFDWTSPQQAVETTHLCALAAHHSLITALYATEHYFFSADEQGFILSHKPSL